jgi:hypothetical protein
VDANTHPALVIPCPPSLFGRYMEEYGVVLPLDDWRTILFLAESRAEEEVDEDMLREYFDTLRKARRQLGWEPR